MNKKKILFPLFLLSPLFILGSCTNADSSSSEEVPDASEEPASSIDNTIGDAYEGDSRPNYGSDFDYDSDYTPIEPDDPNYKVVIKLAEDSPVLFKNGTRTIEVKPNYLFKEEDFDLSSIAADRKIAGMSLYLDENNEHLGDFDLGTLRAPKQEATIRPYFSAKEGYEALDIGSGANSKFNTDGVPGTIASNGTVKYNSGVLVKGGKDGYTEKGVSFVEPSRVDINSGMRLDTTAAITVDEGNTTCVYEFTYNFENLGSSAIHFDAYQISASAEYKKGSTAYESRYRMDIDLEAGESTSFTVQYALGSNKNALTYFVADKTMKDGFSLGMSMAYKKTSLTEVDAKYSSQEAEATTTGKVKLHLPEGITVSEYEENQTAGASIAIPAADKITNTTGKTIAGWYIVGEPVRVITSDVVVSDIEEYTIAPYFAPETGSALVPGTSSKGSKLPDYMGHTKEDGTLSKDGEMDFKQNDAIVNGTLGKNFSTDYEFAKGDYFRLVTASNVTEGSLYRIHFTLRNNSDKELPLKLYQVQSGVIITEESGAVSVSKTIGANSSESFDIEIRIQSTNENIMTIFMLDGEAKGLDLDVAMSQEKVREIITSTLTIEGGSGITFADGSTSVSLEAGSKLPEIKNETGRTLLGFYNDEGKFTTDSFEMPAKNTTIRPYFAVRDGYTRLWAMNGQSSGVPGNFSGSITASNFEATASGYGYNATKDAYKTVVKSENGLDEEGVIVKTNVGLQAKDAFRFNTVASPSGAAVVTTGKEHSYIYTFENRGTSAIHFDVYAVNSGIVLDSGTNNHFELNVAAGESATYEIKPTFTGSANKNTLTYFIAKENMDKLNFAVAMSAKFN